MIKKVFHIKCSYQVVTNNMTPTKIKEEVRAKIIVIIGIVLTMFAGGILTVLIQAESNGYLPIPYVRVYTSEAFGENTLFISACTKIIPYWMTTEMDFNERGGLTKRCSSIKSFNI